MNIFNKETLSKDIFASLVLFLVALPLCLGVSIASGVDPIKGIFTGIIGGVFIGILSAAPLQVSGPSAGLAVMVFHVVDVYGVQALVPLGIIVGIFQIATAYLRLGYLFQATPPALLKAMLSGVGALIAIAQLYVLFDFPMSSQGLKNLVGLPTILTKIISLDLTPSQIEAGVVGVIVIGILAFWQTRRHKFFEYFPGPLVSTVFASALVYFTGWQMKMIQLPKNIFGEAFNINYAEAFAITDISFYLYACGFAFVASAETLLCVSAVDKMAKTTSSYNKQIMVQGIGNLLVGSIGAIPVVGVIVRSAANVEFGAKTKLSSILHGIWITIFLFIPGALNLVPIPALAGLLIFTGIRLLDISHVWDYIRNYNKTSLIFFSTFTLTVTVDLLAGVVAGFVVAVGILVFDVLKFDLEIMQQGENKVLKFKGKLSFLDLPVISKKLAGENLEDLTNLEICLQEVEYLDPAIYQHFSDLKDKLEAQGLNIEIKGEEGNPKPSPS